VYTALKRAVREVGFRYVSFLGVMDDSMDIYHEAADGTPWLSFTYLDILLDGILDLGAKPSFVFSYTPSLLVEHPQNIFGVSCINIPTTEANLDKWEFLVQTLVDHCLERYGSEELRTWRFMPPPAVFLHYGVFSVEDYLEYYRRTCRSIRKILPEAQIHGFCLDTGFIALDGPAVFRQMLDYCQRNDCLPDAFSFQCFSCDYSRMTRTETEKRISFKADKGLGEPAQVSQNPHVLRDEIRYCREILEDCGLGHLPIYLDSWNSTIWQNDLSSDTCYKSAFLVKNLLENCGDLAGIAYSHLTDNSERMITNSSLFHGGYGLFTHNGIPKAGYFAFHFLTMLEKRAQVIVAQGEGYLVTRSANRKQIQVLLYHYCHYDRQNHISHILSREEQCSVDRYYCFEQKGVQGFHLYLQDVPQGFYEKYSYSITRDQGSSYDYWMRIGAPDLKGRRQIEHLDARSGYGVHYEMLHVTDAGQLTLSTTLDEHEVCLIFLEHK
ncbi:MAG: hypothetical protein LUD78_03430, partial [Clostridiales bacterium]|nr:hypothetical protein [Clostridiales bacterium]